MMETYKSFDSDFINNKKKWFFHFLTRLDLKIVRLPSPDQRNSGGADSKYFIEPLKARIFSLS